MRFNKSDGDRSHVLISITLHVCQIRQNNEQDKATNPEHCEAVEAQAGKAVQAVPCPKC